MILTKVFEAGKELSRSFLQKMGAPTAPARGMGCIPGMPVLLPFASISEL
jgi:hypothetical protein